jgi:hypothetical protein
MKKQWLLVLIVFVVHHCLAQKNAASLKNITYYSASPDNWVAEIRLTEDSLFFIKAKALATKDGERYEIAEEEVRGNYFLIYVKSHPHVLNNRVIPPRFGVLTVYFSKGKDKMFMMRGAAYTTLEKVKDANATTQLESLNYHTWYSEPVFSVFTNYPDLKDADKATMQKVVDNFLDELKQNNDKFQSIRLFYIRDSFIQEYLTTALINNHLNPLTNTADIYNKLTEYHIPIPPQLPGPKIIIDEPIGNYKPGQ